MDRGAWWATVHGVTKSRTQLSDFTFTFTMFLSPNEVDEPRAIIQSEVSQKEKDKYRILMHIYGI